MIPDTIPAPAERLQSTSVALLPRQLAWLDARAAREGLKRSDLIRRAIEVYRRLEERAP